jgi:hypothetical protein
MKIFLLKFGELIKGFFNFWIKILKNLFGFRKGEKKLVPNFLILVNEKSCF